MGAIGDPFALSLSKRNLILSWLLLMVRHANHERLINNLIHAIRNQRLMSVAGALSLLRVRKLSKTGNAPDREFDMRQVA